VNEDLDDLARDVAQRWTATDFANLELPLSLAEALDRLALAYGFEGRNILGWEER
jgi:hypothetical protein